MGYTRTVKEDGPPLRPGRNGGKRPGAGRPQVASDEERDAISRARAAGRSALPGLMNLMLRIALDNTADRPSRIRAAEFVANRCGMPPEQRVTSDSDGKTILAIVAALAADLPSDDPTK